MAIVRDLSPFPSACKVGRVVVRVVHLRFFRQLVMRLSKVLADVILRVKRLYHGRRLFTKVAFRNHANNSFEGPLTVGEEYVRVVRSIDSDVVRRFVRHVLVCRVSVTIQYEFRQPTRASVSWG